VIFAVVPMKGTDGRQFEQIQSESWSAMSARVFLLILMMAFMGCVSQQDKALIEAAGKGDVEGMRHLIDRGADVNVVALDDWTPLTRAATNGRIDAVRLLIASGADVNKSSGGLSPLFFAADGGHVAAVRLLLENGAQLTFPNAVRKKFLDEVGSYGDPELLKLLASQL
jgi:ankyrin repeat protein